VEDDISDIKSQLKDMKSEKKASQAESFDRQINKSKTHVLIMTGIDECFVETNTGAKRACPRKLQTFMRAKVSSSIIVKTAFIQKTWQGSTTVKVTLQETFMADLVKKAFVRDDKVTVKPVTTLGTQVRLELLLTLVELLNLKKFNAYMEPNSDDQPMINVKNSKRDAYKKYSFTMAMIEFRDYFADLRSIPKKITRLANKIAGQNKTSLFIVL